MIIVFLIIKFVLSLRKFFLFLSWFFFFFCLIDQENLTSYYPSRTKDKISKIYHIPQIPKSIDLLSVLSGFKTSLLISCKFDLDQQEIKYFKIQNLKDNLIKISKHIFILEVH